MDLYGGRIPRPTQKLLLKALLSGKRFIAVVGNRFGGKSSASEWGICNFCLENPGVEGFIGRWFKKNLYGTTLALWRELFPMPEWSDVFEYAGGTKMEPEYIQFKNGSLIYLVPLQNYEEKLRGGNFSFGFIDQMEECPQKVWTQAVACVRGPVWRRETNAPYKFILDKYGRKENLSDTRRFIIATVNKNREWYWIKRLFKEKRGIEKGDWDKYFLIENNWDENKEAVASGYYRDLEANATSDAQIAFEVYGEDPSEFGLVFPDFSPHTHCKKFEFTDPIFRDATFYISYDEGFDAPSAFIFAAITPDGTHWIRAEHTKARWTIAQHQRVLIELAAKIGFPLWPGSCRYVADPSISGKMDGNGVSISEQWGPRQWPWENGSRDEVGGLSLIRTLMQRDAQGHVKFVVHEEDCPNLVEQVQDASYDEERPGKMLKRCVDHVIDTVRYLVLIARTPGARQAPVSLDGKWKRDPRTLRVGMGPKNQSWLAPSFSDHAKLFVPRHG